MYVNYEMGAYNTHVAHIHNVRPFSLRHRGRNVYKISHRYSSNLGIPNIVLIILSHSELGNYVFSSISLARKKKKKKK